MIELREVLTPFEYEVYNIIEGFPYEDEALTANDLREYFIQQNGEFISERTIRLAIAKIRRFVPIVNLQDGKGYFVPDGTKTDEALRFYKQEHNRAMKILVGLAPLRKWLATQGQVEFGELSLIWESEVK